ncbi:hypothetical protein Pmar_PMAR029319 [Perkinsus marinus ATCC 50983]|uniref:EF-hand domain-containing protein n=1 Tax=Perkinsus marinus (strain ATCC 50983 / TXsc) TaxID=423536 RepID=C5KMU2_PERM5|nr:hypothetical protein Pmar_PMAR029319 [Perkinsus marinus ATCC 50983]EER14250.1 hypothetical protein Pmar_PMAR029319 [Perkinsus marinus ATCC 50983]|eukprot:XP_002782455.1 hypothetical protein Pmar_PMAR029319 [Perkinsus marinus ATCC 50983]
MDITKSGIVTKYEFDKAIHGIPGIELSDDEVHKIFERLDVENKGMSDYAFFGPRHQDSCYQPTSA